MSGTLKTTRLVLILVAGWALSARAEDLFDIPDPSSASAPAVAAATTASPAASSAFTPDDFLDIPGSDAPLTVTQEVVEESKANKPADEVRGVTQVEKHAAIAPRVTAEDINKLVLAPWYTWRYRDDLETVAERIFGDADLYPLLVDANEARIVLPDNLVRGTRIKVPKGPFTEADLRDARDKANETPYTWWLGATLRKAK